jgi:hypothetical protein
VYKRQHLLRTLAVAVAGTEVELPQAEQVVVGRVQTTGQVVRLLLALLILVVVVVALHFPVQVLQVVQA